MNDHSAKGSPDIIDKRRDHLANERTFLSWIRTSIGIMAFGFVVEKFTFFLNYIQYILGKDVHAVPHPSSSLFGVFLVGAGFLVTGLAFIRYRNTAKQIDADDYKPSMNPTTVLAFLVLAIGIALIIYLAASAP